jgi:pyruvate formate lyase activating enzyme
LQTVMVSNGFVTPGPLQEITAFIDAFNIDLKAFNSEFYKKLTGADIEPVKSTLRQIVQSGKHLEITTLIIPGQNDSEREMAMEADWIAEYLGKDVPLHLSRYFPTFKRKDPATTGESLDRLAQIASQRLDYVYKGNTFSGSGPGQNTACPNCGETVTIRRGYNTVFLNLTGDGKCANCGNPVYRYFSVTSSSSR